MFLVSFRVPDLMDYTLELPSETLREILQWFSIHELYILKRVCRRFKQQIDISSFGVTCTDYTYSFELSKWARENGCPWDWRSCSSAAKRGHLDILKWARGYPGEDGSPGSYVPCPWDFWTCAYAAREGHWMF